MKVGAIVQARTSSTRFPGKVLKNLPFNSDITVLEQVIMRLKQSKMLNKIIIATTTDEADKKIVDIAEKENVPWFRGSKYNVLERYYFAAEKNGLDVVVRITGDCPCVDPAIVDNLVKHHLNSNFDYTSNTLIRTFPVGLDVEVISFNTLKKCYSNAESDLEKEHVTTYIHNNLGSFKTENVKALDGLYGPQIRITLDTKEDYALLCAVFDYLYKKDEFFKSKDILALFNNKPWLRLINNRVIAKKSFETFEDELKEAIKLMELQELKRIKEFLEESL